MKTLIAALALSAASAAANEAGPIAFTPVPTADAIAYFRRICVDTLPEPSRSAAVLSRESGWVRYQKRDGRTPVIGHFWRSVRGELGYQNLPGLQMLETNPGCHYSFRTTADYRHEESARAVSGALG